MRWLAQNKHTKEGEDTNEKWIKLQRNAKFQWTNDHENVLHKGLECRRINLDVKFSNEERERHKEILS